MPIVISKPNVGTLRFHADDQIPKGDWIWVFASDAAGRHRSGTAKVAHVAFGARYGESSGPIGRAYGIVVTDKHGVPVQSTSVVEHAAEFVSYARQHPRLKFFVTRLQSPIFTDSLIAPLFKYCPENCSLPAAWEPLL